MIRHNRLYKIPLYKKLIIVDFMGTLVESDSLIPNQVAKTRIGVEESLNQYKLLNKKIAIASDASEDEIKAHLNGLGKLVDRIYSSSNVWFHSGKKQDIKNLYRICDDFNIDFKDALMIGDSAPDMDSANHYGLDYILVPNAYVNPDFDFRSLRE